jgi:hypothetical protein
MKEIDYTDQGWRSTSYSDRRITSAYTPYGIKCMDSDYCSLIMNIHNPIKGLYLIHRRRKTYIDYKGVEQEGMTYETVYPELPLDHKYTNETRVIWKTPYGEEKHDFFYEVHPKINPKTRKISLRRLKADIKANPHLHQDIKDNLLLNLKNR